MKANKGKVKGYDPKTTNAKRGGSGPAAGKMYKPKTK